MAKIKVPEALEIKDTTGAVVSVLSFRDFLDDMVFDHPKAWGRSPASIRESLRTMQSFEAATAGESVEVSDEAIKSMQAAISEPLTATGQPVFLNPAVARQLLPFFDAVEQAE